MLRKYWVLRKIFYDKAGSKVPKITQNRFLPHLYIHRRVVNFEGEFRPQSVLTCVPDWLHAREQSTARDISAHLQRAIVLN